MIKVMRFLKRAEHLWLEEFTCWWLEEHAFDMAHHQPKSGSCSRLIGR